MSESSQDKVGVNDPPTEKLVGFGMSNPPRYVGERETNRQLKLAG
jgi:hypothetical protein